MSYVDPLCGQEADDALNAQHEAEDNMPDYAWVICHECSGEFVSGHDCGEDVCACLHPDENMRCQTCNGRGGWNEPPTPARTK